MAGSRLVVNNRVMLRGAEGHAAIGGSRLLYIANREGAVKMKTEDDLRIEAENERMAKLGYIGFRPGSVAERNSGHALFDASGVPQRAALQRDLRETESAIVTSVVSVRREDAEALRLQTKQDWERLLRSQWPRYVESLGVMEAQDVRWVAAFHVNQRNNLHCHVFTWDASGGFNGLLPRRAMAQANEALQAHVLRPQQEALNLRRTQARDELAAALRGGELADGLCENVLSALPKQGSLKYAILCKRNPEAAQAVRDAVRDQVEADARLASLRDEYLAAVQENADLKALSPDARAAYVHAAEADLENRLANALIANARGGEAPKPIARQSTNAAEAYLPPVERRWTLALQEELGSCLTSDERKALRLGIASATEGQTLDGEARRALSKLPTLKAAPPTGVTLAASAEQAIANGAHGIRNIMEQAAGGSRPDAGDDAGRNAMNVGSRILARALRAVLRGIVPLRAAQAPALRVALKLKG